MIQFLADVEKTRFIVGQVICVDGGQSCDGSIESMNFPLSFCTAKRRDLSRRGRRSRPTHSIWQNIETQLCFSHDTVAVLI